MRKSPPQRSVQLEQLENRRLLAAAILHPIASDLPLFHENYEAEVGAPLNDPDAHDDHCCCPSCLGNTGIVDDHDDHSGHNHTPVAYGDGDGSWNPGAPATIVSRITVQPIIVSNNDGSNTAGFFGSSANQTDIEDFIDDVWAQAGIDIDWLNPSTWNSTTTNVGGGTTTVARPTTDLDSIVADARSAGLNHSDPDVLNMYFVEIAAGFAQLEDNFANGLAYIDGNGSTLHIGDSLVSYEAGQQTIAQVVAHEIGHNLGLPHIATTNNLMKSGENSGALLSSSQISAAQSSRFSVEITNNAPTVANPLSDVSVGEGTATSTIDLSAVFSDVDGDSLSLTAASSNGALVNSSVSGNLLTLTYGAGMSGTAEITVTATDPLSATVSDTFQVTVSPAVPTSPIDVGTLDFQSTNVAVSNIQWYEITASRSGFLSASAEFSEASGNVELSLFNSAMSEVATGSGASGQQRIDASGTLGQTYYLRLLGTNPDVDLKLANVVSLSGSEVSVAGSAAADSYSFTPGSLHEISINGLEYFFSSSSISTFNILSSDATDTVALNGSTNVDSATFQDGSVELRGVAYTVQAAGEVITVDGSSNDEAYFYDSSGNDVFNGNSIRALMTYASGNTATANTFGENTALSTAGGADNAFLFDGPGADTFDARPAISSLVNNAGDFAHYTSQFEKVFGYSLAGGADSAILRDSSGDDLFVASTSDAYLQSVAGGFFNQAIGFSSVSAESTSGGTDSAVFYDGTGDDTFTADTSSASLQSSSGENSATGFRNVYAYATGGGTDTATLTDGTADDTFVATEKFGYISGPDGLNYANGFESLTGRSTAGSDLAILYDSSGDETLTAEDGLVTMVGTTMGSTFNNSAVGFEQAFSFASSGNDIAMFNDTAADDTFAAGADFAYMRTDTYINYAGEFDTVVANSSSGEDTAVLYDSAGDDQFVAGPDGASMSPVAGGFLVQANGFGTVYGYSLNGGSDSAIMGGGLGNDSFVASAAFSSMTGTGYENIATGFSSVSAAGGSGGNDTASLFDAAGDDNLKVAPAGVQFQTADVSIEIAGFFYVAATSSAGGTDVLDEETVDYLFESFGSWT